MVELAGAFSLVNGGGLAIGGLALQNAFAESFNGRLRGECLNETVFTLLRCARVILAVRQRDHNEVRPHSALGGLLPALLSVPPRSPASGPLRAGCVDDLRPALTQAARDGLGEDGRDGGTALDRTDRHRAMGVKTSVESTHQPSVRYIVRNSLSHVTRQISVRSSHRKLLRSEAKPTPTGPLGEREQERHSTGAPVCLRGQRLINRVCRALRCCCVEGAKQSRTQAGLAESEDRLRRLPGVVLRLVLQIEIRIISSLRLALKGFPIRGRQAAARPKQRHRRRHDGTGRAHIANGALARGQAGGAQGASVQSAQRAHELGRQCLEAVHRSSASTRLRHRGSRRAQGQNL